MRTARGPLVSSLGPFGEPSRRRRRRLDNGRVSPRAPARYRRRRAAAARCRGGARRVLARGPRRGRRPSALDADERDARGGGEGERGRARAGGGTRRRGGGAIVGVVSIEVVLAVVVVIVHPRHVRHRGVASVLPERLGRGHDQGRARGVLRGRHLDARAGTRGVRHRAEARGVRDRARGTAARRRPRRAGARRGCRHAPPPRRRRRPGAATTAATTVRPPPKASPPRTPARRRARGGGATRGERTARARASRVWAVRRGRRPRVCRRGPEARANDGQPDP